MRCNFLCTMTMMMSASFNLFMHHSYVVASLNLHERRTKKTRAPHRNKSFDRKLQITINPDQVTVISTNSSTDFPSFSPVVSSTVINIDPSLVDPRSCKSGKGRTCTPSARPSVAPSESPSISHMPTVSFQPSARPTISSLPSVMPSPGPTPLPSAAPSLFPSPAPSEGPTQVPTISSPPTIVPSATPSAKPSPAPTIEPTISSQPTITAKPSMSPVIDPNGFINRIVTDDFGKTGVISQCRRDIPSTISSVTDQLIVYEYDVMTTTGTDVAFISDTLATEVQKEMSRQFLTCTFDARDVDFDTTTISSLPFDAVATTTQNCTTADGALADCYRINAAFTATIFYYNDNNDESTTRRQYSRYRMLQNANAAPTTGDNTTDTSTTSGTPSDVITNAAVAEQFSSSLQSLFESGSIASDLSSVMSTEYQGLANDESSYNNNNDTTTDDDGSGNDDTTSRGSSSDKSLTGGQVAGSVIGTLIAVALIAVIVAFFVTRRRKDNDYEYNNSSNNKSRAMDVTQEEFPEFGPVPYDEEYDDRDNRAMIDRSVIASDDGSYHSGYFTGGKTNQPQQHPQTAYIIEDDQETLYTTNDFPNPTEPSFMERIRGAEQPGPTFVKTNEVLYQISYQNQANETAETEEMELALERSSVVSNSGYREYSAPDTVQL